jgi:hypothetical protein
MPPGDITPGTLRCADSRAMGFAIEPLAEKAKMISALRYITARPARLEETIVLRLETCLEKFDH